MKALLVNGSPHEHGCTYTALREVADTLHKHGIKTELLYLGKKPIPGCAACGKCREIRKCIVRDIVNEVADSLDHFDALIVGSPVYYAGPSSQLTSFLERLFFSSGSKMAGKLGACVVSCRRGGATAAFDRLNKFFTIANMPVVPSQYWNQVHGQGPDDVKEDLEGLQTMRTLGENMAWLLKSIEAGRAAGVKPPAYEPKTMTNFIR